MSKKKSSLRRRTIRLASENKALRPHLLKILKACEGEVMGCGPMAEAEGDEMAGRTWGKPDPGAPRDAWYPYGKHPDSPSAGTDGSAQRAKYNQWYRENVCPNHPTGCGMGQE